MAGPERRAGSVEASAAETRVTGPSLRQVAGSPAAVLLVSTVLWDILPPTPGGPTLPWEPGADFRGTDPPAEGSGSEERPRSRPYPRLPGKLGAQAPKAGGVGG